MNGFLANEKEDIIFISSIRDVIDENGQMLGYVDAWCPQKTECPDLSIIGRKILYHFQNFIGEPTTVLLKKSHMYFNPDSQQYEFAAFHGITDRANTDVSTWLDLCTTPGKCIFMAEHLSILRKHSGQKSFDPPIMLASVLDWFNYATIAWLHHVYIQTESEYRQICKNWVLFVMERIFHYRKFHYSSELKKDYTLCEAIVKAIQTEEYEQALHLSITYMLSYIPNPDIILSLCEKNTAGYWCRKKITETTHT